MWAAGLLLGLLVIWAVGIGLGVLAYEVIVRWQRSPSDRMMQLIAAWPLVLGVLTLCFVMFCCDYLVNGADNEVYP